MCTTLLKQNAWKNAAKQKIFVSSSINPRRETRQGRLKFLRILEVSSSLNSRRVQAVILIPEGHVPQKSAEYPHATRGHESPPRPAYHLHSTTYPRDNIGPRAFLFREARAVP